MAIFHLSVKTISRSAGRSATAAIAYRAGEKVTDERTGEIHDYSRRRGVDHTEIFLPPNAPEWASNRGQLWNAAEQAETRKNSTVAREFEVAIPEELNGTQRLELVREFARELVQRHGMAVDVAIHAPGKDGDHRNHHAHILCSTRRLTPEGFKDKTRELDDFKTGEVEKWRERWADVSNRHLENAGRQERIDHRSLEAQKAAAIELGDTEKANDLERLPTVHLGPNVVQMEKRGISTERGAESRNIAAQNARIYDFVQERNRIQEEAAKAIQELKRQSSQRDLNSDLLRNVVADREPVKPANDPSPQAIKREWQDEKARQFFKVSNRAKALHTRIAGVMERQEERLAAHDKQRPEEPRGLFSGFKKGAHEQALSAWRSVRSGLEKRWSQLQSRLHSIGDYMRKAGVYEMATKGERLAEKMAAKAQPELASRFKQVAEQEKAAAIEVMRAKIEKRHQGIEGRRAMKQESIEELKQRIDSTREKNEAAERKKLEKDGKLAAMQRETNEAKEPDAAQTKDDKKREMLERFKEKASRDRDNDRGRGR